jgi:hypothetical protein
MSVPFISHTYYDKFSVQKKMTHVFFNSVDSILLSIKIIEELRPFQDDLAEMCELEADHGKIVWVLDPLVNMGKTHFLKYMNIKHGTVFSDDKKNDIIHFLFKCYIHFLEIFTFTSKCIL